MRLFTILKTQTCTTILFFSLSSYAGDKTIICENALERVSAKLIRNQLGSSNRHFQTVEVVRNGDWQSYSRTNRNIQEMKGDKLYPPEMLDIRALQGLRVVDAGCGDGQFVLDLKAHGIDVVGIDIVLNDPERQQPLFFLERDLVATGLPANSVDMIYSTWSVLHYESDNPPLINQVASEMKRILKPGGKIRAFPNFGGTDSLVAQTLANLNFETKEVSRRLPHFDRNRWGTALEATKK